MTTPIRIVVRPKGRGAVMSGHPWVMADSLVLPSEAIPAGTKVELTMPDGSFLAKGLFNPASRIAVRTYSQKGDQTLDSAFFKQRLDQALRLRESHYFDASRSAVRLVFSEADHLCGLIVDRYGDYIVVQQTAAALTSVMPEMIEHLRERLHPKGILWMVDASTAKLEGIEGFHRWVVGTEPTEPIQIIENDLRFDVDLQSGQKTGYYLDQRDNRAAAARWIPPNSKVLDVCCYVGGFALTIARHCERSEVLGIDTSSRAIEIAKRYAAINELGNVQFEVGDFLKSLEAKQAAGELFDAIVLDPPKLAGSRDSIERALRAYHRLNYSAVRLLRPGGLLVTCSCSGRVSRDDFYRVLRGVSKQSRRSIQILEQRGAAADHPVSTACPETDYLKCFICRVGE
ncbi:MAG: class I SAM-dependent rRNA methyltransferase [Pirellulaceae bacterium]|nr:class I SAM-dependent rRNA methyltransferase [Pirellulaceae bacterium]